MNYVDAAKTSPFGKAVLPDRNPTEVYETLSDSFYTVGEVGGLYAAQRKPGKGSKINEEWIPLIDSEINQAIEAWKAVQERRDIEIKRPWKAAIEASPVKKAFRLGKKDRPMLRDEHGNTWQEYQTGCISRPNGPFKEYDGWIPMQADYRYAEYDLTSKDMALYRKPLSPEEIAEEERQRKAAQDRAEAAKRNARVLQSVPQRTVVKNPAFTKPDAPFVHVPVEVVAQAGTFCQAISAALPHVDGEDKKELVAILKQLTKNFSWHLREDRRKYQ